MKFSAKNRLLITEKLKECHFDVLIIGGGITGAGIALDTATRGMNTALVEMQDFSAGTSSRSTKLVHGGLRYLKQLEVKMVSEVGKERAIVYENGLHVTSPEWMLLPIYKKGTFGKWTTSLGLKVYDYLAGVKKGEHRRMLSPKESLEREPLLKKEGLQGSGYYVEYRTDDARLTIEVLKAAVEYGATALNYTKVVELQYDNLGKVCGVAVADQLTGEQYRIFAEKIVNAAGPWVDTIREMDESKEGKVIQVTKGIHIVIDQKRFPLKQAVYFDTEDKRMLFAIPRGDKTYVGTTDTFYNGDLASPKMSASDRDYLINAINNMFPEIHIQREDIESSWAGVRPLIFEEGKKASEISRKDEVWESDNGLITIAGGKLTGYRKMAELVADLLAGKFRKEKGKRFQKCITKSTPIAGGDFGGTQLFESFIRSQVEYGRKLGLAEEEAKQLVNIYGTNVPKLYHLLTSHKQLIDKYQLPTVLILKLIYSLEYEMVVTPLDFFIRRTGALMFNIDLVRAYKDEVIKMMGDYFQWEYGLKREYQEAVEQAIITSIVPFDEQLM